MGVEFVCGSGEERVEEGTRLACSLREIQPRLSRPRLYTSEAHLDSSGSGTLDLVSPPSPSSREALMQDACACAGEVNLC